MAEDTRVVEGTSKEIKTKDLVFDPENPRFTRQVASSPDIAIAERMVRDERIAELMQSIGVQNFFAGEPLLITEEGAPEGKYIVVEGNRRLAAVKLLNGEHELPKKLASIENIKNEARFKPEKVPCIIFGERKDILRYLGFRHITGIKAWGPLAKARYLEQLRDQLYADYPVESQLKMLAKEIGSRSDYVGLMLAGLSLYDTAKATDFFGLSGINEKNIDFTLLTTAISYKNISDYLGLQDKTDSEAEDLDYGRLKDIFSWIYSQDQQGRTIVADSRQLKELSAIVADDNAVEKLREKGDLSSAYLMTEGPLAALSKLIGESRKKLLMAYDTLSTVNDANQQHMDDIDEVFQLSKKIRNMIRDQLDDD